MSICWSRSWALRKRLSWTDRDAVWGADSCGPKNNVLYKVKVGRIHSPPRGMTRWRGGLWSKFFDHLSLLLLLLLLRLLVNKQAQILWSQHIRKSVELKWYLFRLVVPLTFWIVTLLKLRRVPLSSRSRHAVPRATTKRRVARSRAPSLPCTIELSAASDADWSRLLGRVKKSLSR